MSVRRRGVILIRLIYHHYIEKPNKFLLCIWRFCYNVHLHLFDETFNMYTASTFICSLSSADDRQEQQPGAEPAATSAE